MKPSKFSCTLEPADNFEVLDRGEEVEFFNNDKDWSVLVGKPEVLKLIDTLKEMTNETK